MSDKYEITGTVKLVGEMQTFGSGFTKRPLVVTTADKYPQDVQIEFVKEGCSKLDGVGPGDEVTVAFNIRGSEYNGRYFVNLQGWKLDKLSTSNAVAAEDDEEPGF